MAIMAGIDEAGYGPTFGPLVITGVVFNVPDNYTNKCLWHLLGDVVTKIGQGRGERIVVDDSKKVYSPCGLKRIEDGTLSFLWCLKGPVTSFLELLKALSCYDGNVLSGYPWYAGKDLSLPIASNPLAIANNVQLLTRAMAEKGIKLHGIRSVPVSTIEFNRQIDLTGNKLLVLFQGCAELLTAIWKKFGTRGPKVFVDKHGGRSKYHHLLSKVFHGCQVKTFKESGEISTYEIKKFDREMVVSFIEKAEDKHFPVALASMYSKYMRELFIKLFNAYWQEKVPGLRPTAGYPLDAKRYLQQICEAKKVSGITDQMLIRKK
ncbi:MAG TPA: hypothetical protein VI387_00880 [Candidatus Brocadiales bacterium]|nr:hypothetical protein [Candidatus Brocadiales bacterium]